MLDLQQGPHGTLLGHVARGNGVWRELHPHTPSVVAFQGPQAYITPGWYPGKTEHGRVVITEEIVENKTMPMVQELPQRLKDKTA